MLRLPYVGRRLACLGLLTSLAGPSFGWVYPEHRDIAVLGVQTLDTKRAAAFDTLWREVRAGHEKRLCEGAADAQKA